MLKSSVYDAFSAEDIRNDTDREHFLAEYKSRVEVNYTKVALMI